MEPGGRNVRCSSSSSVDQQEFEEVGVGRSHSGAHSQSLCTLQDTNSPRDHKCEFHSKRSGCAGASSGSRKLLKPTPTSRKRCFGPTSTLSRSIRAMPVNSSREEGAELDVWLRVSFHVKYFCCAGLARYVLSPGCISCSPSFLARGAGSGAGIRRIENASHAVGALESFLFQLSAML